MIKQTVSKNINKITAFKMQCYRDDFNGSADYNSYTIKGRFFALKNSYQIYQMRSHDKTNRK